VKERVRIGTDVASRYQRILNLPQSETERLLTRHAASLGISVERGVRLTGLDQADDGVDITLTSAAGAEQLRSPAGHMPTCSTPTMPNDTPSVPAVIRQTNVMTNLAEVTINYRASPIVQDHGRQRRPQMNSAGALATWAP
jgi:FAD binding domain